MTPGTQGTSRTWAATCGLIALIAALYAAGTGAHAAPLPLQGQPIEENLNAEPLPDFLSRFFSDQGLTVVLSEAVRNDRRTLNGPRSGTPAQVFRSIANSNGLLAYYDGMAVYVYLANERISRDFSMTPDNVGRFMRAFYEFKLGDDQNNFNASPDTGIVMVSGARRFVQQAEALANSLGIMSATTPAAFKYLPLKYAWASDTSMTVGNRQVVVPGVASILRQLMGLPAVGGAAGAGRIEQLQRPTREGLRGQGLASQGPQQPGVDAMSVPPGWRVEDEVAYEQSMGDSETLSFGSAPPLAGAGGPQVVADAARNAVIVRDHPDRLALYEELVRSLDTEPKLVEIEATIIDVNKGKLRDLGINWRWSNGRNSLQFGRENQFESTREDFLDALLGGLGIDGLRNLPGLTAGGIIGDSDNFLYRINLLEQEDVARVVSRPQVATLNDVEAVIENTQTFYVPVGGAYEVDLFNVVAGTTLRVTPHVIDEDGRRRIRMVIAAEDGGLVFRSESSQADQIPLVTRSSVNTHALINEGESVLLGGLVRNADIRNVERVPVLGSIPFLGALFRRTNREMERTERLFLITPRLVAQNHITGQRTPSSPNTTPEYLEWQDEQIEDAHKRLPRSQRKGTPTMPPVPVAGPAPAPSPPAPARPEDDARTVARYSEATLDLVRLEHSLTAPPDPGGPST
ncbi:type III secretion system outer membrane ring subunit SctC [Coralloluteibacterium stylophorae]|uniref:Type 3 secretion system secretin n=1 Tax=Coralloluteibacterium stylophorae TaxID=1776034 RepID=A0AAP2CDW8_9GAMM|nr:type III secretion system outer membrane ring subunit SctC [Coralloluteibacterium stylophorae]MBS7458772.1 type III secretion system outer membrane ring subunit SctC [Coralloluteibacterium stylophorae]